jgi:twin-argninine leader-binding protein dmsD
MQDKNIQDCLEKSLKNIDSVWADEEKTELNKPKLLDLIEKTDEEVIKALLNHPDIKRYFFTQISDTYVFKLQDFRFFLDKHSVNNSYTRYANRIGLSDGVRFLKDSSDIVLDFPFKDCILNGGQSSEEGEETYFKHTDEIYAATSQKRKEIFFNQTLAFDEIDRLLDAKAFSNCARYTKQGKQLVGEIKRNTDGTPAENLIIKGNNLVALHSLATQFKGKIKLIYIDPPYNTGSDGFKYNDKFNHSTWLTFMKNRLEIAREFLRDDGVIFVQCDDNEQAYLKVLMDEIFGRENFVNSISIRSSTPSGLKTTHREKTIIKTKDYILVYAKKATYVKFKPQYIKKEKWDTHYNSFFNRDTMTSKKLVDVMIENNLLPKNATINDLNLDNKEHRNFYIKFADCIYQTAPELPREQKKISLQNKDKVISYKDGEGNFQFALNGRRLTFLNKTIKPVLIGANIENDISNLLCDFWGDIDFQNTQNQGGIDFENAKKPEQLLYRIIDMTTQENDIILDFFAGSGTTLATAMKMGRKFIGVEQMDYVENITCERIKKVINGEQGGVSKALNWQGGGEFIYAELASLNQNAKQKILSCVDLKALKALFNDLYERYFLKYTISVAEFTKMIDEPDFKQLPLDEQKRMMLEMLDLNQMYISLSEINDRQFKDSLSDEDRAFSVQFYQKEAK